MPLDPKDRDRLEKLLNMLGSDFEGERANAGAMIKKIADRYNVTPAALCLDNRIGSAAPEHPQQQARRPGAWGESPFAHHPSGRSWDDVFRERDEDIRRSQARREEEVRKRQQEAQQRRERERRQAEAKAKSVRKAKLFPGTFFGLLARLKGIYEASFDDMDDWKLDFIEDVLGRLHADRQMTIREREMAKAVIKFTDTSEPLV